MAFKILYLVALLTLPLVGHAQSNLRFVDAKYIRINKTQGIFTPNFDTTIVVPSGRVWKVESADVTTPYNQSNNRYDFSCVQIDRVPYVTSSPAYSGANVYTSLFTHLPVWLPAGSYTLSVYTRINSTSFTLPIQAYFSSLEFVLTP